MSHRGVMKKLLENFTDTEIMAIFVSSSFFRDLAQRYAYQGSEFTDANGKIMLSPRFCNERQHYVEVHQKIKIGEIEINAPYRVKPEHGTQYWFFEEAMNDVSTYTWIDDCSDNSYLSGGNCFKSKDDAIAALNAIKSLLKGK